MRILITGSSGQIGTNLTRALANLGVSVFCVDQRPNPWLHQHETVLIDLRTKHALTGLSELPEPDAIVHLAANAKVHQTTQHPHLAFENLKMLEPPLMLARRIGCPFIFSSSREVYGSSSSDFHIEGEAPIDSISSPYAASKLSGEAYVSAFAKCYCFNQVTLRLSNVYGRFDNDLDRMERVIPLFMKSVLSNAPITVYGRDKKLDFTFVDDAIGGIMQALELVTSNRLRSGCYNLGRGQGHSLLELIEIIESTLGKSASSVSVMPTRPDEVVSYIADIAAAKRDLGYTPVTSLEQGITKAWKWWRSTQTRFAATVNSGS